MYQHIVECPRPENINAEHAPGNQTAWLETAEQLRRAQDGERSNMTKR